MTALQVSDLAEPGGYVLLAVGLVFALGAALGVWGRPRQLERAGTEDTPPAPRAVVIDVGGVPVVAPLVDDTWRPAEPDETPGELVPECVPVVEPLAMKWRPGTRIRFPSTVYGTPADECHTIAWARLVTPPHGTPVLTECGVLN